MPQRPQRSLLPSPPPPRTSHSSIFPPSLAIPSQALLRGMLPTWQPGQKICERGCAEPPWRAPGSPSMTDQGTIYRNNTSISGGSSMLLCGGKFGRMQEFKPSGNSPQFPGQFLNGTATEDSDRPAPSGTSIAYPLCAPPSRLPQPIEYMKRDFRLGLGADPDRPPPTRRRTGAKPRLLRPLSMSIFLPRIKSPVVPFTPLPTSTEGCMGPPLSSWVQSGRWLSRLPSEFQAHLFAYTNITRHSCTTCARPTTAPGRPCPRPPPPVVLWVLLSGPAAQVGPRGG